MKLYQFGSQVGRPITAFDSVNVVSRTHYLPAFSRLGAYPRDRLVSERDRLEFERSLQECDELMREADALFKEIDGDDDPPPAA